MGLSRRWMAIVVGVLALTSVGLTQGQRPRVTAQLSSGVVRLGERAFVRITVEGTDDAKIVETPELEGLSFGRAVGPRTSSSTQIERGRIHTRFTCSWDVPFRPEKEGDFDIPPFVLEVQGKRVETRTLALRVVVDIRGADLGFLEIHPSSSRVVEGQPFTIDLSFGWDLESEINFADLYLPWWNDLPGTLELERPELPPDAKRVEGITINRRVQVTVEELDPARRDGRVFRVFRLTQSFLPTRSGKLELPTSSLEFGRETQSFSLFRRPERRSYYVRAEPVEIEVIPLPTEGQPFDFSGAVGRFELRASVDTRDVVVGDSIKLKVEVLGSGNLEFFEPPDLARLDSFGAFRVYGHTDEKSFERRVLTYDIAPLTPEAGEIPSVPLTVFDPEEERYETLRTEPIPIRVRPLENPAELGGEEGERFERDLRDIDSRPLVAGGGVLERVPGGRFLAGGYAVLPLLWLGLRTAVRRRRGDPAAPLERRRRRALRSLKRDLRRASSAEELERAFARFLAARTKEPTEAWIGRAPLTWWSVDLRRSSDPPEAIRRADELVRKLDRAAWGREGETPTADEIVSTAHALTEVL